ncbi:MAG: cyclase family protein, partial [Flavobacteriales bacterium]|nr:cyclase family protein [Flavobacteriales bacterium]
FFFGEVISVEPEVYVGEETEWQKKGDQILTKDQIESAIKGNPEAIIIRTLPNKIEKIGRQYSNTNWPYLAEEAAQYISDMGIKHLLIDLPSVDREIDGGRMMSHRAFWNYPDNPRHESTITELIFVPESVVDGPFFLNIQIASFENDASPSKPLLFQII